MVSIVVPIYNVETYLKRCVDSLIKQSYEDIEIILVDDGSPDSCPEICDEYKMKDNRVVVIHKKNGGLSDARNVGIYIAKGIYITFIDSDDYVGQHYIENLVNTIEKYDASVSICDYCNVYNDFASECSGTTQDIFNNRECLEKIYHPTKHGMEFVAWGKLYKTSLFKDNSVLYPVGKIHEDTFTTYKLLYYAKKIVFTNYVGYFYRQRENSIMSSKFNLKRLVILEATREACDFFKKNKEKQLFDCAVNSHFRTFIVLYSDVIKNKKIINGYKAVKRDLLSQYRWDLKQYIGSSKLGKGHKILYKAFGIAPIAIVSKLLL